MLSDPPAGTVCGLIFLRSEMQYGLKQRVCFCGHGSKFKTIHPLIFVFFWYYGKHPSIFSGIHNFDPILLCAEIRLTFQEFSRVPAFETGNPQAAFDSLDASAVDQNDMSCFNSIIAGGTFKQDYKTS